MWGLSEMLGIKVAASTAYHPQTDGQTEHVNQEVEQFLHLIVNQRQDDWYDWILVFPRLDSARLRLEESRLRLDSDL